MDVKYSCCRTYTFNEFILVLIANISRELENKNYQT